MKSKALLFCFVFSSMLQIVAQEKWTCYTNEDLLMNDYRIVSIFDYVDGSLWIATDRGIDVFDGKNWKKYDENNKLMKKDVGAVLVDNKDRVWIGTGTPEGVFNYDSGSLLVYNGKDWKPFLTKDIGFKARVVSRIYEHSSGDIWVGVQSTKPGANSVLGKGAILRYTNDEWIVYKYKDIPCYSCDFVKGFAEDADGKLWLWGKEGLAYFYDEEFYSMTKKDGYLKSGQPITATYIDNEDKFWIAGPGKVAKWDNNKWTTYTRKNGLPAIDWRPHGISETPKGDMILAMTNGVYRFDGVENWPRDKKEILSANIHFDQKGSLWVPTYKGLEIRNGDDVTFDKDLKAAWAIITDQNNGVWAFTAKDGAKRFKDNQWTYYTEKNKLPSRKIKLAHVAENGTVWIGTDKGICKCEYE